MDRLRKDAAAITAGAFAALVAAVVIDGSELFRVRAIAIAYGHSYRDAAVIFGLVLACALIAALATLAVLTVVRTADRKALVVCAAIPLSVFACLPVYWYVYRDAPPGWHINIAEEHRWAQPAAVVAALIVYGLWHLIVALLHSWRTTNSIRTRTS